MRKLTAEELKEVFILHDDRYIYRENMIGAAVYHSANLTEEQLRGVVEDVVNYRKSYLNDDEAAKVKVTEKEVNDAITDILKTIKLEEDEQLEDIVMGYLLESHGPLFYNDMELITKLCKEHEQTDS